MQLSAYEIAIIGGGFTVVGVLLGSYITYRFALILGRKDAKRSCGRRLLEAFSTEMAILNPTLDIYPGEIKKILLDSFHKHRAAMIEYSFHLTGKDKIEYETKCNNYYSMVSSDKLLMTTWNPAESKNFIKMSELFLSI